MNYKNIYNKLIETRKSFTRSKKDGNNYESHHILPKSLGGSNEDSNLILLTPREHFLAHLLLIHCYEGKQKAKMVYASWRMCLTKNKYIISSRQYEIIRTEKKKIPIWNKGLIGKKNPQFGVPKSEAFKRNLSEKRKGDNNPSKRQDVREKLSVSQRKRMLDPNERRKISISLKGNISGNKVKVLIDGIEYVSATEAARKFGVCVATILYRVKSKNKKFETYKYLDNNI